MCVFREAGFEPTKSRSQKARSKKRGNGVKGKRGEEGKEGVKLIWLPRFTYVYLM